MYKFVKILLLAIPILFLLPLFFPTFAQDFGPGPAGIPQLQYLVARLVCIAVPMGFTAMFVVLVIAGIKFLVSAGEAKAISSANLTVTWAFLGVLFMAIAWLILLLIQNATGAKVTEFNLATLPGVQGFSGSCWAPPPKVPNTATILQPPPTQQNTTTPTCNNGWFTPIPVTHTGVTFYTSPEEITELEHIFTTPTWIRILVEGMDRDLVYTLTPEGRKFIFTPGGLNYFTKLSREEYDNSDIYPRFIEANRIANNVAASILEREGRDAEAERLRNQQIFATFNVECSGSIYLGLEAFSPLIYLYPTQTTDVELSIKSPIISAGIPLKSNTWYIRALPNGTLTTANGKHHKFIPYEFLRSDFKRPEKGMVIEKGKLEEYLKNDLWRKLGLTNSEVEDYWWDTKGRVQNSPYYFVSLIERNEIDRVLPMEVNPKPDTIIRNMTYILPLSSKPNLTLQPLEITASERVGFTVLENGVFTDGF